MATHWFSPPVYVKTDRPGVIYGCNNVEGAAEELLKWTKMGPKWRKAVQLCIEAVEDRVTPEEARKAFEAAAKEEGVLRSTKSHAAVPATTKSTISAHSDPSAEPGGRSKSDLGL